MIRKALLLAALLAAAPAAASDPEDEDYSSRSRLIPPGGFIVLFYDSEGPMSFILPAISNLPAGWQPAGEVTGRSCQNSLSIPLVPPNLITRGVSVSGALGDGGYRTALADIQKRHPGVKGLYDVKVDLHTRSFLGIFSRLCTLVNAQAYR